MPDITSSWRAAMTAVEPYFDTDYPVPVDLVKRLYEAVGVSMGYVVSKGLVKSLASPEVALVHEGVTNIPFHDITLPYS